MARVDKNRMKDIFGQINKGEGLRNSEIVYLKASILSPFSDHPFKFYTESKMIEMVESIKENGVLNPLLVRPQANGYYEIIAGHNRWEAAKRAKLEEVPVIIKDVDDETAAIMMVDTNFNQREEILPSEKAFAYKIKLEAIKKQVKDGAHSAHLESGKKSRDVIANEMNETKDNIRRYIRLTELIPSLLNKVDNNELGFIPAVDISYLTPEQQGFVEDVINLGKVKPTKVQAAELKKRAQEGTLTKADVQAILMLEKEKKYSSWNPNRQFKELLPEKLRKEITPSRAEEILTEAMLLWTEKQKKF